MSSRPLLNILDISAGEGAGVMLGNNVETWLEAY